MKSFKLSACCTTLFVIIVERDIPQFAVFLLAPTFSAFVSPFQCLQSTSYLICVTFFSVFCFFCTDANFNRKQLSRRKTMCPGPVSARPASAPAPATATTTETATTTATHLLCVHSATRCRIIPSPEHPPRPRRHLLWPSRARHRYVVIYLHLYVFACCLMCLRGESVLLIVDVSSVTIIRKVLLSVTYYASSTYNMLMLHLLYSCCVLFSIK